MNENLHLHMFNTIDGKTTDVLVGLEEIIELIQHGDKPISVKALKGNQKYRETKSNRNVVAWNTAFNDEKTIDQPKDATGFMYMRKDNINVIQIKVYKRLLMQSPFVSLVYANDSGTGVECIVKCKALTRENFGMVWHQINRSIGICFNPINTCVDQLSTLSYDPNIECNPFASTFSFKKTNLLEELYSNNDFGLQDQLLTGSSMEFSKVQDNNLYIEECHHVAPFAYDYELPIIKYKTEFDDDMFGDNDYLDFPDGIPFYEINTYYEVSGFKREATMYCQAGVLALLNPEIDEAYLMQPLFEMNRFQCMPALPFWKIKDILSIQYKRMQQGKLKVKPSLRKVIYKSTYKGETKEKQQLNGHIVGKFMRDSVLKLIEREIASLKELGKEIFQTHVAEKTGKCIRPVKTYWKHFKEDVMMYNNSLAF